VVAYVRQHRTGFADPGELTFEATFLDEDDITPRPALADSCIVWIIAGDKDCGTITQPTDFALPINDRTSSVSQALAYGTADGGETTISGTVSANVAGGQVWIIEIADPDGTGPWARRATVTDVDTGADRLTVTLDPTPATTQPDGVGVAAVAADSVNTAGTEAWTGDYDGVRVTPSGGGNAGQWGALREGIPLGDTTGTTFSRTGGTADNHSGLLVVFSREPAAEPDVEGEFAMSGDADGAGALAGTVSTPGEFGAVADLDGSAALTASITITGEFAATTGPDTAALVEVAPLPSGVRVGTPIMEPTAWRVGTPVVE
jgi:hypothetical protein